MYLYEPLRTYEEATYSCGKCELQIVGTECLIVDGYVKDLIEETRVTKQILRNTKPKTEKLRYLACA